MIVYRSQKGAPLSADEVDGNFKDLATRIKALEDHKENVEGIGKIAVLGDQMTITGTFGKDFGTFALPKTLLKPRGLWVTQMPYQKLDVVSYEIGLYCCVKDHTSKTWDQEKANWQEMLSIPRTPPPFTLYEKATIPAKETTGKIAILVEEKGASLLFFDGKKWQIMKGENI
jgi:hypothetical protein